MATDLAPYYVRKLFRSLIYRAIQRCRTAESLCRLSISIGRFQASNPPSMKISISDTGVGSSLVEFQDLNLGTISIPPDKWDGVLSITTTGIGDTDVYNYYLNLREELTSGSRLNKLPSMDKNQGTFSGTEVCFSTAEEYYTDDFMAWVFHFVQKWRTTQSQNLERSSTMLLLKVPNVAVDLRVEHANNLASRYDELIQEINDMYLPHSMSNIERLNSTVQTYVLRHRNPLAKECHICFTSRELKFGSGVASNNRTVKGFGWIVEVAVVISATAPGPESCPWRQSFATSQVMYFQDFTPMSISQPSLDALTSIDWQRYGLRLKGNIVDGDGNAVLQWEDMPLFGQIDIAIHCYLQQAIKAREHTSPFQNLIKRAVKIALDDLKAKYAGLLLSCRAHKICKHVPNLSRAIAGLIFSTNDSKFHSECASLLGLHSDDVCNEEAIDSCIGERIVRIIEMSDHKRKIEKGSNPCLFDCESQLYLQYRQEKDENTERN